MFKLYCIKMYKAIVKTTASRKKCMIAKLDCELKMYIKNWLYNNG